MPRLQLIEVGFQVLIDGSDNVVGTIQAVEPEGKAAMVVHIEGEGDFEVPYLALKLVRDGRVFLEHDQVPLLLWAAIEHARESGQR